jgi:hypothetical protein
MYCGLLNLITIYCAPVNQEAEKNQNVLSQCLFKYLYTVSLRDLQIVTKFLRFWAKTLVNSVWIYWR